MRQDDFATERRVSRIKRGMTRLVELMKSLMRSPKNFQSQLEQEAIIKSFAAMKDDKKYLEQAEKIEEEFNSDFFR